MQEPSLLQGNSHMDSEMNIPIFKYLLMVKTLATLIKRTFSQVCFSSLPILAFLYSIV